MKDLLQSWPDLEAAIRRASRVLLLADYDGTLTPIVGRPEDAVLAAEVREKLRALATKPRFTIGVISGRALSEIKAMVGIEGIYYAGNHGLEIGGPGLGYVNPVARAGAPLMKEISHQLSEKLSGIAGVIIQDKVLSISVHYRLVKPQDEKTMVEIFRPITSPLVGRGKIRVTSGKKVFEVRPPVDWDKGKAVEAIIEKLDSGLEEGPVIYLGDDSTDEDAFKVVRPPRGRSVFIGPPSAPSHADYFLPDVPAVEEFLGRLGLV